MKKRIIILFLLVFFIGQAFAVTINLSNESGENIEYTINKGKFKGWRELQNNKKISLAIKSYGKITIQWRNKKNIFVSQVLNRPVDFTFQVGGRYKIVEKNWIGKKSKPVVEIYLYAYKRLPEYLLLEKRAKFLLPLKKLEEGMKKVKETIIYYGNKINESKRLVKHYGQMLRKEKNKKMKKTLTIEKDLSDKRVKAYSERKKECENLEQELLIREIIEKYKKKINDMKAKGHDSRIEEDSMHKHEDMFEKLTGKALPKIYLS